MAGLRISRPARATFDKAAVGHRNNSAVNYHFRNRQDLIHAVVARRCCDNRLGNPTLDSLSRYA
jgi:hypothetical protein